MVDTFTGTTPAYTELLMKELENARDLARAQYQPYVPQEGLERVAPFTPLQQQTFGLAEEMGREQQPGGYYPEIYGEARGAIRNALGQNVAPFINRATGPTDIAEFYNPFQEQVIRNLESEGARNLQENILPNVNTRFIGAGQYGSTGHQDLTNRAIRDTIEAASKARAGAQAEGFNTALNAALGKQQTQLQGGQLAGKDIERQMLGGEALQNLAGARQTGAIRNIGVLGQLGGQQQQQGQNISNIAYENYQRQANFPYQKQSFLSEQLRGLQPQTQVYPGSPPVTPPMQPQASPYTQAGGLLAGMTGAYNQRPQGFAHGGAVKKLSHHRHYADGGSLSPIQKGANHAIDTAELQSVREQANKFAQPNVDPFWASIARAGFDVAANRQPGVLAKLGQAGGAGLSEYHSQLANQDERGLQSAKIMEMIDNTKRLQAERNREHAMKMEEFGEKKRQFGMEHSVHAGRLGLEREKFEHEKKQALTSPALGISPEYEKSRSREEAKHDVKHSADIREQSRKNYESIQRIDQILDNLEEAKLGPGFDSRKYIASSSQALGIDIPSLGDPRSMLEVKKGLTQLALEDAKSLSVRPTNFDLETIMEGLPQTFDSPEAARQVLESMKVFKEFGAQQDDFKDKWERDFGSIRKKAPNGITFEKAYRQYADKRIWPKLQALNKKYEVKK